MKNFLKSICAVAVMTGLVSLSALAQPAVATVKSLADSRGSLTAGDLIFSNFQAPPVLPFNHPQGALPNDAGDIAVATTVKADGRIGLVFTPIDPATGSPLPLFINSQRGSPAPGNLVRNITFDVTSTNPLRLLHSITIGHGPGSNSFADASVANIAYYVEPGTGSPGLLVLDSLNTAQLTALLPGGDFSSLRFGDELELTSNHNRGGSVGTASVDSFETTFTLVASNVISPPVSVVPNFVGANAMLGGTVGSGFVRLNVPAQAGGAVVILGSSNPALAAVPGTVTVPQGAFTAGFPITAAPVLLPATTVGLTAALNGVTVSGFVQIFPAPPLAISTVSLTPAVVVGGAQLSGTVTMNVPLQALPATVALTSNNPAVTVPSTVDVPLGASAVNFVATTTTVGVAVNAVITATFNGTAVSAGATVNPAPGAVYTLTVTRSGSGTVTATPSGIGQAIDCGNACTANFNQGTTVTLSATPPSGKAFSSWSGACSGSNSVCTLVMNGNAAVQAIFR
jgi:hypothetical protein